MNLSNSSAHDFDTLLADFAAELTSAAYPVALQHGMPDSWLDLELDLWRALAKTVENRPPQLPRGG